MSNICMDTVIFYSASGRKTKGLQKMKEAVASCYPEGRSYRDSRLANLFNALHIPTEGISLRSDVIHYQIEDSFIQLECDSAWNPMKDAYEALSRHFNLKMVFTAEEPGSDIYYNTDDEKLFLEMSYKVVLLDCPVDGSLDALFKNSDGDTDFYFNDQYDLLQWFQEKGNIMASSMEELWTLIDSDHITIHEYTNPY